MDRYCTTTRDEDCRKTALCARLGRCSAPTQPKYAHLTECVVAKDEDCRDSEVCKRFGWCAALKNPSPYVSDVEKTVCFTKPPEGAR